MDLPNPPEDGELKNIVDKLAVFVARNGPEFEHMTKEKQKDNPRFSFLFGGEYFNYYQYRVSSEQAIMNKQQMGGLPPHGGGPPGPHGAIPWQNMQHAPPQMPDQLEAQVQNFQDQIKHSEMNLSAQYQSLIQQQQIKIDELIHETEMDRLAAISNECGISLEEMAAVIRPIVESCTKDAISNGKNWIFSRCTSPLHSQLVAQFLCRKIMDKDSLFQLRLHLIYLINDVLHHCVRKNADDLRQAIEMVVVPIFCTACACAEDKGDKLTKLLNLWEQNKYFSPATVEQMRDTTAGLSKYQADVITKHADIVTSVSADVTQQYSLLQQQHNEYVQHINSQLSQLEAPFNAIPPSTLLPPHSQTTPLPLPVSLPVSSSSPGMPPNAPPPSMGNPNMAPRPRFPPPNLQQPPPNFSQPPPGFNGPPPPRPQQFDYAHGQGQPPPPVVQDYNHGQGGPPPPPGLPFPDMSRPPPGFPPMGGPPIVPSGPLNGPPPPLRPPPPPMNQGPPVPCDADLTPSVPYYELPAGLMAPLVKLEDNDYKALDSRDIRLPPPMPPSERLLAAVEAFYSAPSHERPRDSDGWEKLALFEFNKAKRRAREQKEERQKRSYKSRSRSRSKSRSRSRSWSPKRRRRSRSRSRSRSKSYSRSRSRSPQRRRPSRSRSVTPPGFFQPYQQGSMDSKLGDDNKGHQLLRKMGWGGGGLGSTEQGIVDPIKNAQVRDRSDMYRGVGVSINDPFEQFRKNKSQGYTYRMKTREDTTKS